MTFTCALQIFVQWLQYHLHRQDQQTSVDAFWEFGVLASGNTTIEINSLTAGGPLLLHFRKNLLTLLLEWRQFVKKLRRRENTHSRPIATIHIRHSPPAALIRLCPWKFSTTKKKINLQKIIPVYRYTIPHLYENFLWPDKNFFVWPD